MDADIVGGVRERGFGERRDWERKPRSERTAAVLLELDTEEYRMRYAEAKAKVLQHPLITRHCRPQSMVIQSMIRKEMAKALSGEKQADTFGAKATNAEPVCQRGAIRPL